MKASALTPDLTPACASLLKPAFFAHVERARTKAEKAEPEFAKRERESELLLLLSLVAYSSSQGSDFFCSACKTKTAINSNQA